MAEKRSNGLYRANFTYTDPKTKAKCRCRHSLGTRDRREALRREAHLRVELETPKPQEVKRLKDAPMSGFAKHWYDTHVQVNLKPSTVRCYEQALRVHLVPFFRDQELKTIEIEQVELYKARKLKEGLAPKTVNNHLGILSRLFTDAVRWRYAAANPVTTVNNLRSGPQELTFWDRVQSEAFLAKVRSLRPPWEAFFTCALHTGMRLGELLALRWGDVDFVKRQLIVRRNYTHGHEGTPKSGRNRVVPMSDTLFEVLRSHRHLNGDLVFPDDTGSYLRRSKVKHPFWTCTRAAGLPRIRIHDLRHSFASQLVMAGVPLAGVKELLGHSDVRMTMRYAHLSPAATAEYVRVLDGPASRGASQGSRPAGLGGHTLPSS